MPSAKAYAIHKRQLAAARLLLDSGARADEVMDGGATPLMFAAAYGDTATCAATFALIIQ
jgi:ankyrin repeat protein